MDDSDQDFVDLCSKLLKRVRKKPNESRQARKAEPPSQAGDGDKCKRTNKRHGDSGSKCAGTQPMCNGAEADPPVEVCGGLDSGDAGASGVPEAAAAGLREESGLSAKDKVLLKMQKFKRVDPQRIVHKSQTTEHEDVCDPPHPPAPSQDAPEPFSSDLHPVPQDSDEALALRLQQELDQEAAEAQPVDLEEGGLFFCQICHKDLSHMTPEGRTQHLNRCLDESEQSAQAPPPPPPLLPPPPPPPPGVPDCPICGKKFKSQKSRLAHLKRCSTDLGVSPALLMQAVQRQAEETQIIAPAANTLLQTGGTKRKGPSKPSLPARKKPRKKIQPLDEDTMVAMALSSSLLEQQRESERHTETAASHTSVTSRLKWRPDNIGKGRGKKKRGAVPPPPSLLLVQDANTALTKLQERVSALLLRSRPPSPPTPTRCPSTLPGVSGAAPLWQRSTLLDGSSTCLSDFYTSELREFITPWEPAATDAASSSTTRKPESLVRAEGTPLTASRASILPSSSQMASSSPAPSTPGTGQLAVGSQALRDLMELAEDGMTLTQCGYNASGPNKANGSCQITNLRLSGFVLEESEEQADLCVSGFLPETTHTRSEDMHSRARQTTDQSGADRERSVALSRLASDLSSMVNNPQLSDVQLQVDSGEVYFAHSFMVYARCPLLAEMMHESGFGVQEEGMPAAQRVLINDVPGQAVIVLLRYLYAAHCSIPASVRPHVLELASRFDLKELQELCELHREDAATQQDEEDYMNEGENLNNQTDQALVELLRSMWNEEDDEEEEEEGADTGREGDDKRGLEDQAGDLTAADIESHEEKVNEDELEEIYEFAATQRKRDEEDSVEEEEEEEKVDEEGVVFTKLSEDCSTKNLLQNSQNKPDLSLDRSYSRLFSESCGVYEEGELSTPPSTSCSAKTSTSGLQRHQTPHKATPNMSCRTLLQSSGSVVEENSLSPPRSTLLPVPGWSPGLVGDLETNSPRLKRESQGPKSICVPLSPRLSQKKREPELIVLSDSSEEMEEVLSCHSLSPCSPPTVQTLQSSHTQIKPQPDLRANESTLERKKSSSLDHSPGDLFSAPAQSCAGDCSPEVSWLIPSTPVQRERSTSSSSTQTRSSMCRTLFPKHDASSSSVFSSPALPSSNRLQTSDSPSRESALVGPLEGSILQIKQEEMDPFSASLDLDFGLERESGCDVNKEREVFAVPSSQVKVSHPLNSSSKQDTPLHPHLQPHSSTPLHPHLQPYSSTPLHTQLHLPPQYSATSPLRNNHHMQKSASPESEGAPSESQEKTELGSFHLSPLSDPTDPPSSSSCRGLQSSHRHSESSRQSQRSVESSRLSNTEPELTSSGMRNEEGDMRCGSKEKDDEGENREEMETESKEAELSVQQSFVVMDEPPIAFNDSWGLDPCMEENPGCFSLRLEDSRGSSQQDQSPGLRERVSSSSPTDSGPPPTGLSVGPSKGRSGVRTLSPPKPSTPQMNSLLDSNIWDSWKEDEEEEEALPLSQRLNPPAQHKTPAASHNKRRRTMVPITPMPHYSDMDTPDLKNKLNRFGVRPLPKRQMILKLKEIHQYTHQLVSSDSDGEGPAQVKPPASSSGATGSRPAPRTQTVRFKEPRAPAVTSPLKHNREEELLSASQGSNTSSTAEESERSNPELCASSDGDSDSDGGISASQVASRHQDRLQAVRSFILSDPSLYSQVLQYQPLVLSQLQERLKASGIRLGAAKLVDFLDSQCITFTTAKPGHSAPSRRRGKKPKAAGDGRAGRKKAVTALL
ncbi:structure-specific endonuclease subunit SLX4 isoform X2 [Notolabrus celidotus]|uniref:structure-specific endonuclease subunit SLX4 isoform X2 n=1 Tax=Notolabrus celidotus TaxID=1203425 RepID=UPI00148F73FB|nr:structure-specific endonuclease subunit SLX4 isoform X2 [Notolabrus celidotus]